MNILFKTAKLYYTYRILYLDLVQNITSSALTIDFPLVLPYQDLYFIYTCQQELALLVST
jgi:hypothetical protein